MISLLGITTRISSAFVISHIVYWVLLYYSPVRFPRLVEGMETGWRGLCDLALTLNPEGHAAPGWFELLIAALRTQITGKELVIVITLIFVYWMYAILGGTWQQAKRIASGTGQH